MGMEKTVVIHQFWLSSHIIPVTDPEFPRRGGGHQLQRWEWKPIIFPRKLYENERNWTRRGGRASLAPPLDPPLNSYNQSIWRVWKENYSKKVDIFIITGRTKRSYMDRCVPDSCCTWRTYCHRCYGKVTFWRCMYDHIKQINGI